MSILWILAIAAGSIALLTFLGFLVGTAIVYYRERNWFGLSFIMASLWLMAFMSLAFAATIQDGN